jgi:hypothetical protein
LKNTAQTTCWWISTPELYRKTAAEQAAVFSSIDAVPKSLYNANIDNRRHEISNQSVDIHNTHAVFAEVTSMLLLKLGSIAIVPVIYSVVLGEDAFFERMRVQGELLKLLFLTFYATLFFFQIFGRIR